MPVSHLILGGARSGKSHYAEKTAHLLNAQNYNDALLYLATATAGDDEMRARIEHHQERRGSEWRLHEEPIEIAQVIESASSTTTVLIDCLTLWLSNCLHQDVWPRKRDDLLRSLSATQANVVMVSNEVGSGIIPLGKLSRRFVDESGWLHQEIARIATHVTLVVAGLDTPLKRPPTS